jgi:hypothetical protein
MAHPYDAIRDKNVREAVDAMSRFVNGNYSSFDKFCEVMSRDHRTLQASFTKLCIMWLEHNASLPDTRFDDRNKAVKEFAVKLKELFTAHAEGRQDQWSWTGELSAHIPMI